MAETLRERLEADLKVAMRAGDHPARDTIRYLLAAIRNAEIERRGPLTEPDDIALLRQQLKQRSEAIEQFRAGRRDDLVAREQAQLTVVERYLPEQLSDADLDKLVRVAIAETGAAGPRDLGKVMRPLTERVAGRADGRRLADAVRRVLAETAG